MIKYSIKDFEILKNRRILLFYAFLFGDEEKKAARKQDSFQYI